jgi:hypothetical protein
MLCQRACSPVARTETGHSLFALPVWATTHARRNLSADIRFAHVRLLERQQFVAHSWPLDRLARWCLVNGPEDAFGVVDVDVPESGKPKSDIDCCRWIRVIIVEPRFFARVGPPTCLEHIALRRRLQRREDEEQPEQVRGSNLRRVRRLSLGLVYLFVRLGGSLLDVERELDVVVVDANAVARLD